MDLVDCPGAHPGPTLMAVSDEVNDLFEFRCLSCQLETMEPCLSQVVEDFGWDGYWHKLLCTVPTQGRL